MSYEENAKSFYSKILLFGEYSVIQSSMALSLPYSLFEGSLTFRREQKLGPDPELRALGQYLKSMDKSGELDFPFDVTSFEFDIGQGLYFNSTIPQGFGVGSSGALCAALYDRYSSDSHQEISLEELRRRFALLESHFHGSSSGMDPLISYKKRPILMLGDGTLEQVCLPSLAQGGDGGIFLLNTGRARRTEPLVNLFLEKCNTKEFKAFCLKDLLPKTNECITHFLEGQWSDLYESFHELSRFQFEHFKGMIPKLYQEIWLEGIETKKFALKLCGAGGGGFLLGMTPEFKSTSGPFKNYEIRPFLRF